MVRSVPPAALFALLASATAAACPAIDDFPGLSGPAAKAGEPDLVWTEFVPIVLAPGRTEPVVLRAMATGAPSSLRLTLSNGGGDITLLDNGAAPDAVAGDGIYSVTLAASAILSRNVPERVGRPVLGQLRAVVGSSVGSTALNVIADVAPADLPNYPVALRIGAPFAYKFSPYVVTWQDDAFHADLDYAAVTQRILPRLGDHFDFVDIVSVTRGYSENRFHGRVRNAITGIGVPVSSNGAAFGSPARLQGFTLFPNLTFYDPQARAYNHEIGHQWINALAGVFADGSGAHWPPGPIASDVMGLSGSGGQGISLSCRLTRSGGSVNGTPAVNSSLFNPYELYLMGLVPPSQVPTSFQFSDAAAARALIAGGNWCRPGIPLAVSEVDVQQIIGANGARSPNAAQSQKFFKVLTVAPSRGRMLDDHELRYLTWLTQRGERDPSLPVASGLALESGASFFLATGGRARLEFRLNAVFRAGFE